MLTRDGILARIPHKGASCMLDSVQDWADGTILCRTRTHLETANPLRHAGRLHPVCGAEYGLQAAALHGALRDGHAGGGWLASLRGVTLQTDRLDNPAHGTLLVQAWLEAADPAGLIYRFALTAESGAALVSGRGTVLRQPGKPA